MATERIWPDVAIPPGEVLAETLGARSMTQAELARRTGRPVQAVNEIIRGTKAITPETALQLERVLGVPAHVWTRLEADYRFNKARLEDEQRLVRQVDLVKRFPYGEMAKRGWVPAARAAVERVRNLLSFFGVGALDSVSANYSAAFRRSAATAGSSGALAAWLRQGQRKAAEVRTLSFDKEKLRQLVPELRQMPCEDPQEFEPRLRAGMSAAGVAIVLVPHLPRTGVQGATFWRGASAAIEMTLRYRWQDVFWFTLLHEVGHLLLHDRNEVFVDLENERPRDGREAEADDYAANVLLAAEEYGQFLAERTAYPETAVKSFAKQQGIPPGIVIGRLCHDGRVPWGHLIHLRRQFEWVSAARPGP
ncbi:MAG: HigA family addiction module antidote protein [Deltaproteobacteria bacterium]|nr:HigA family addiction module antidote protein [Deltaproteobacteria bacterium]